MHTRSQRLALASLATLACAGALVAARGSPAPAGPALELDVARIYWEYNSTDEDLGVHVFVDGEEWKHVRILHPDGKKLFSVTGKGPYAELGLTELFYEGAEPDLVDVPLEQMLESFPAGQYSFVGKTVDNVKIHSEAAFSHAIPDGPEVFASYVAPDFLHIDWNPVVAPPAGFPAVPIDVVAYQVIVDSFEVTVPASVLGVTVPPELVATLDAGEHEFEVLAIEASANQTLTSSTFDVE